MLRFLKIIFTRRWGWALIAALIVFGGGLWGWTSSTTPLLSGPTTTYTIAANALGDVYFITKDNSTFFVARHNDFDSTIDLTHFNLSNRFAWLALPATITVNDYLDSDLHVTQAHIIEQLIVYNSDGSIFHTYTKSDYQTNANGFYDNRWFPTGSGIMLGGLLIGYGVLFVGRKRKNAATVVPDPIPHYHTLPYKEKKLKS
jgi:hypothetical protein